MSPFLYEWGDNAIYQDNGNDKGEDVCKVNAHPIFNLEALALVGFGLEFFEAPAELMVAK